MAAYREEYDEHRHRARRSRGPELFMVRRAPTTWTVRQTFDDPEGDRDWGISATVDLADEPTRSARPP